MAKAIINKHIDSSSSVDRKKFVDNYEKAKGEILICNDKDNPGIYILDTDNKPVKINGGSGGTGGSYDDTLIRKQVEQNTSDIKALKESGVGGSSVLTETIVVAGLENSLGAYSNNDVIEKGTSLETIFKNILTNEVYPSNVKNTPANVVVNLNDLTVSYLQDEIDNSDIIEVGTLIKIASASTNGCEVLPNDSIIDGITYGYSLNNNNIKYSSDTSISKPCTFEISNNEYTLSLNVEKGFNEINYISEPVVAYGEGLAEIKDYEIGCLSEGENIIKFDFTGAIYSYSADSIDKIYYCSNLGKTNESKFNNGIESISGVTDAPIKNHTKSFEAKYKYFIGYTDKTDLVDFNSELIRSLDGMTGWIEYDSRTIAVDNENTIKSDGKSIVIACPSMYELHTITNSIGANIVSNFNNPGTVMVNTGNVVTEYNVYIYPIKNNTSVEFKNVSFIKA